MAFYLRRWAKQPQGSERLSAIAKPFYSGFLANFSQRAVTATGQAWENDTTARLALPDGVGLALKNSAGFNTSLSAASSNWLAGATEATFICVFIPHSVPTGTAQQRLFTRWSTINANSQFIVQMRGPNLAIFLNNSTSVYEGRVTSGFTIVAGGYYACVATFNTDRSGADRNRFWINGQQLTSANWLVSGSIPSILGVSQQLTFGKDAVGTGAQIVDTTVYLAGAAPIDVGDKVAQAISENAWGLFEPRRIWVPQANPPILSLPTYVPGSLTASGFRPRVTAS